MENSQKAITDGLVKAMKAERYGHSFYLMAANSTTDAKGKEVFETLAREELAHMHFLRKQYNAIKETGRPDESISLGSQTDLSGMSPIFSDSLKTRIKDANFEMTSLAIGIQLEKDSMEYYNSQSEAVDDPIIKQFYSRLAEWESGHYRALLKQQEELKEDFWSEGGFAPF
jgi:rubrerythrin